MKFFTHSCANCREPQYSREDSPELENYRLAIAGEGPRAYDWKDKPHRLVYDLIHLVKERDALIEKLLEEKKRD